MEYLLPAGEFYIQKTFCVVQIAAIHTEKGFDALVELRLVVVQKEREIHQVLFLQGRRQFEEADDCVHEINGIEIKKYNQEEILQFKDDDRFDEAFCFSEESPDVLAVAAIIDDEIVGKAGASADSPSFWQIGINVNKNFEGRHIASGLVSMLKADILHKGIVPYYGTSFSNLASQHVAAKAGFEVAWVELITGGGPYGQ